MPISPAVCTSRCDSEIPCSESPHVCETAFEWLCGALQGAPTTLAPLVTPSQLGGANILQFLLQGVSNTTLPTLGVIIDPAMCVRTAESKGVIL